MLSQFCVKEKGYNSLTNNEKEKENNFIHNNNLTLDLHSPSAIFPFFKIMFHVVMN